MTLVCFGDRLFNGCKTFIFIIDGGGGGVLQFSVNCEGTLKFFMNYINFCELLILF